MSHHLYNVLFLCTGNSARSIMAEALLNKYGNNNFQAFSAGSHPVGNIHPLAIERIKKIGYPIETLRSKSWNEFLLPTAPTIDIAVTVCDHAAHEICPLWPSAPIFVHWGFPDPALPQQNEGSQQILFEKVYQLIRDRIDAMVNLPCHTLDRAGLKAALDHIGEIYECSK